MLNITSRFIALAAAAAAFTVHAAPAPQVVAPIDMGAAAPSAVQTISIVLKVQNPDLLDSYITATVNPRSPLYHHFLSVEQFRAVFAPPAFEVKLVTDYLQSLGVVVNEVYRDNLIIKATGTVAQFNQAFSTSMHEYRDAYGHHFRNHKGPFSIPRLLQDVVLTVAGLNTQSAQFRPMNRRAASGAALGETAPALVMPPKDSTATGVPGSFTVGDVASLYNVNPLYSKGVSGRGRTVGIATLANFDPADAYTYWSGIGLSVDPNRITQVHVDGGGVLSSDAGSGETALNVEQSGGLAPAAKVLVYDAPNTDFGFIDLFYKAVSDNLVDTLSVSWGESEMFYYDTPATTGDTRAQMVAMHQAFGEAAVQGISMFAASGDDGAYDSSAAAPPPVFSTPIDVDSPAADPYITAAGGTTLPGPIQRKYGVVTVPTEQVWGWDYFNDYLVANYGPDFLNYYFATGGGGGVSIFWPTPDYQRVVSGLKRTEPNQVWSWYPNYVDATNTGASQTLLALPGRFAGRNSPDISLNADPYTGYLLFSTPDGGWIPDYGGTSFVAPQLNGIFALLSQAKGSRLGLVNPQLYQALANSGYALNGPLNDITAGDDWFYRGITGYDPGAGLGTINAAALLKAIR